MIVDLLDGAVALTGNRFERLSIKNADLTSCVSNKAGFFKRPKQNRYPASTHAQHRGDKRMGYRQHTAIDTIVEDQQPSREPMLQGMVAVSGCRLGDLAI